MTTTPLLPPAQSLPVPTAEDRAVWSSSALDEPTIRGLRERAEADLATPWPVLLAHGFARYARDGDRAEYESVVFAREFRLSRAAVMAAVTFESQWIDEVADGVMLLCEQSTWCFPAHDDTFQRGAMVTDVERPYLDLFAGQYAAQLAWIDHLLGAQLDERYPGLRARIRHEVDRRVLTPFVRRRDWHWLQDMHNWSAWIHGNVLVAGLVLLDDDAAARQEVVGLAIEGLERYVASLPSDGAIDEGCAYWWQGACRALEALDVLDHASQGKLGGITSDTLREVIAFPHRMHFGGAWYLSIADCPARQPSGTQPWYALHRAARRVGDREAEAHAAAHRRRDEPVGREEQDLGRLLRALTDQGWVDAVPGESPLPREVWLPSTQVLLARSEAGTSAGLTLAIKGGHNGEHHNHNDVGGVVVALNGVPVIVDPGRPTYTSQTFGPNRYDIWTMQSGWHSVPEILGAEQAPGAQYAARDVAVHLDEHEARLRLELAGAYPSSDIETWRRDARLDRRSRQVRITDSWRLRRSDRPTRVNLIVAGTVDVGEGHATITALDDAGVLRLTWTPADTPCIATVRPLDDPWLSGSWGRELTRLELDVSALGPAGTLVWTLEAAA